MLNSNQPTRLHLAGEVLDSNQEHEIFYQAATNCMLHGFYVRIHFRGGAINNLANVTEVHWRYNAGREEPDRVAFESDFHGTGRTVRCDVIARIAIMPCSRRFGQMELPGQPTPTLTTKLQ